MPRFVAGLIAIVLTAMVAAAPAGTLCFAQSYDPSVGSGNIAPLPSLPVEQLPSARRGRIFVSLHCARCHAIDRTGASPVGAASPLRDLHLRYAVADLQRPLAEGIHPNMPLLRLSAGQVADVMAYLNALER
jgi:cytochrome c